MFRNLTHPHLRRANPVSYQQGSSVYKLLLSCDNVFLFEI